MMLTMKHVIGLTALLAVAFCTRVTPAQNLPPTILQQFDFGGSANDVPYALSVLPDGGMVIGGESSSTNGTHASAAYGAKDFWLVRLDASGGLVWERSYGGVGDDRLYALALARSNRVILAGSSSSPPSGNKASLNYGVEDFWVILVDANGQIVWERSFGGAGKDFATCVAETEDGGFVVGGYSQSPVSGNKTAPLRGSGDFWLVRLDASGNKLWDQSYGGAGDDCAFSLVLVPGGSMVLAGNSDSVPGGNKTSPNYGYYDLWVLGLDSAGNILWDQDYGGDSDDGYYSVSLARTADGNLYLGTESLSGATGNKTSAGFGMQDYWVLKLDSGGNRLWETNCGGMDSDYLTSLRATTDGGCLAGGGSNSRVSGNKTAPSQGSTDFWLVKLDAAGQRQWEKVVGGPGADAYLSLSLDVTTNGVLVCCGDSLSEIGGDKTVPSFGLADFWVVTLGTSGPAGPTLEIAWQAGVATVVLRGQAGSTYVTEASADLGAWTPVSTNQLTGTSAVISDPGQAGSPSRYYRARLVQ